MEPTKIKEILKTLRENKKNKGTLTFGNQFYSVKFFNDKISKNQTYGHKYGFYLEDIKVMYLIGNHQKH